jgi:competence protein ComEA
VRHCWLAIVLCTALSAWAGVDANTANEAELDSVRGLGPGSTARILAARDSGPFTDWADLMRRVKGIKPSTAQKLSQHGLTVNNVSYPGAIPDTKAP